MPILLLWCRLLRLRIRVSCKVVHISFKVRVKVSTTNRFTQLQLGLVVWLPS